jgi:hypothetical protein
MDARPERGAHPLPQTSTAERDMSATSGVPAGLPAGRVTVAGQRRIRTGFPIDGVANLRPPSPERNVPPGACPISSPRAIGRRRAPDRGRPGRVRAPCPCEDRRRLRRLTRTAPAPARRPATSTCASSDRCSRPVTWWRAPSRRRYRRRRISRTSLMSMPHRRRRRSRNGHRVAARRSATPWRRLRAPRSRWRSRAARSQVRHRDERGAPAARSHHPTGSRVVGRRPSWRSGRPLLPATTPPLARPPDRAPRPARWHRHRHDAPPPRSTRRTGRRSRWFAPRRRLDARCVPDGRAAPRGRRRGASGAYRSSTRHRAAPGAQDDGATSPTGYRCEQ